MIAGWDIGGAQLKCVIIDAAGAPVMARQVPNKLWLGVPQLSAALRTLTAEVPSGARHALTMTGELADAFADRASGVAAILDCFGGVFPDADARVFGRNGFTPLDTAHTHWIDVASANWYGSASLLARMVSDALMLDIGSTTSDIVAVREGAVCAGAWDDFGRLASGELLYTGVVRTPLMALADRVPVDGRLTGTMAELFATSGDVYRLRGELSAAADCADTADGRSRSSADSAARLARMVGRDAASAAPRVWADLADWYAERQLRLIVARCVERVAAAGLSTNASVVGLGAGAFLARRVAARLARRYIGFAEVCAVDPRFAEQIEICAPAYAVARLLP
jgi:probable H4MPT-linked C1 transfer pathway protein